jgi:hypothetical protein
VSDKEMHAGITVLKGIAETIRHRLQPMVEKLGENKSYGRRVAIQLRDMLFPKRKARSRTYETLATLQALLMFYAHLESHFLALGQASRASWDREFIDVVEYCEEQVGRLKAWATEHLKVKAPQSLLVPDKGFGGAEIIKEKEGSGLGQGEVGDGEDDGAIEDEWIEESDTARFTKKDDFNNVNKRRRFSDISKS